MSELVELAADRDRLLAILDRVKALTTDEPGAEDVPECRGLYWRRVDGGSQHVSKGPDKSWCAQCQETCSRLLACSCCWEPVDQMELRDALQPTPSTKPEQQPNPHAEQVRAALRSESE